MKACASCACSGVAVLPGADRPDGLVRDHQAVVAAGRRADLCAAGPPRSPPPRARPRARRRRRSRAGRRRGRPALAGATVSSVSPKYCRRSEWPTIAPSTPSSAASPPRPRPVNAPSSPSGRSARRPATPWPTAASRATRTAGRRPRRRPPGGSNGVAERRVSARLLNIFQLPAISSGPAQAGRSQREPSVRSPSAGRSPRRPGAPCPRAARARRRRRSRPTRSRRRARAPCTARTESPPPTTV